MRFLLAILIAIPLFAQPPAHKNLKILKDDEVRPMMGAFVAALGVKCDGCHVADRASDENPKKDIARTMIAMVREDNSKFLAGKTQLTCYTCHRGESMPKTAPDPK
jgi:hypothetical protein